MRYKVAESDDDYKHIKALMLNEGFDDQEVGFPTIMALDGEDLIGFIATTPRPDMVLGGPLVMRQDKMRVFTAVRLVELYENAMRNLGIKSIIFCADEMDSPFAKGVARWFPDVKPYAKHGSLLMYNWNIGDKPRHLAKVA